jgi:predicted urease superfamily metal-dependent hydrolase
MQKLDTAHASVIEQEQNGVGDVGHRHEPSDRRSLDNRARIATR